MTPQAPPSIVAEDYIRLLMQTLAQHRRAEQAIAAKFPLRGRLAVLPSGFLSRQVRYQATLVRLVTIVESFTSAQLILSLEKQLPSSMSDFMTEIYHREENSATGGWQQMHSRYRKSVGRIDLKKCDGYPTVMVLVEARNAIAHGLGTLTRRQQRDSNLTQLTRDLASVGISVDTNMHLTLDSSTLKTGAAGCRRFIVALDADLRIAGFP